jgi:peptidoglycan/xylan/chitin deacetylase (PgdA/CDA1 family)
MTAPMLYLNYHEIRAEPSSYRYSLPAEDFDAHLRALSAPSPGDRASLGVTFDDGHQTQFKCAFPALTQHGVNAIFFVTAGFTGSEPDYMSWQQLRELAAAGHEIQAHGWLHRFFTHCSDAELEEELRRPKETIEDRVGRTVDALSFPGGRFDTRVLEACRGAGYRRVFTSEPWPPCWEQNGLKLFGRFGIESRTPAADLRRLMRTGGRPSTVERLKYKAKMSLRRALGDERYHRLWLLVAHGDAGSEQNAGGGSGH